MSFYGANVEYALHTLLNLGWASPDIAPSARDLADFQRLPVPYIRKLLTQLEKSGLITGAEGFRGGWALAREPGKISVLNIVNALKGDDKLFDCREIRAHCAIWEDDQAPQSAISGVCAINAVMQSAEAAMKRELAKHTLADLADRVSQKKSGNDNQSIIQSWFEGRFDDRKSGKNTGEKDD
jgi:Rrf2 family protein